MERIELGGISVRIAVLGSGAGGLGVAFDWATRGHHVALCGSPMFGNSANEVAGNGGISATGELSGFAPVAYSGSDARQAISGADLIFIVGPAFATETLARRLLGLLDWGQSVVVCPSSCLGSVVVRRTLGLSLSDGRISIGETNTLPYAVRKTSGSSIHYFKKVDAGFSVAGLPHACSEDLRHMLSEVYPTVQCGESILQTTLQNGNPVIHPAVTLLNAAHIQRTGGDFEFYAEGITEAVGRLIEVVDRERIEIGRGFALDVEPDPHIGVAQGYMLSESYVDGYRTAPGFKGIKAQSSLDSRYLTEDVGYSLMLFSDLATKVGVAVPAISSLITLSGIVLGRDFRAEGSRSLASLGLERLSASELAAL